MMHRILSLLALAVVTVVGLVACSGPDIKTEQATLHLRIGTALLVKGAYPQALGELLEAERLNPSDPIIQNNLGLALFARKEFQMARDHIARAVKLKPNYSDARNNLGRVDIELGRYAQAIKELQQVTDDLTYPMPEKAYVNLGLAYLKQGNIMAAQNSFRRAIDANSRFCPAYNYDGQALFQLHKYGDALIQFDKALELCNNSYDEAHYYSALSLLKNGDVDKAKARFEEVVRLYPDSSYADKAKAILKTMDDDE